MSLDHVIGGGPCHHCGETVAGQNQKFRSKFSKTVKNQNIETRPKSAELELRLV